MLSHAEVRDAFAEALIYYEVYSYESPLLLNVIDDAKLLGDL